MSERNHNPLENWQFLYVIYYYPKLNSHFCLVHIYRPGPAQWICNLSLWNIYLAINPQWAIYKVSQRPNYVDFTYCLLDSSKFSISSYLWKLSHLYVHYFNSEMLIPYLLKTPTPQSWIMWHHSLILKNRAYYKKYSVFTSDASGITLPTFESLLPSVGPWENWLTSLCLGFPICKIEATVVPTL